MTNETEISLEEIKTILSNYKGLKKQIRNHISDLYDDLMDTDGRTYKVEITSVYDFIKMIVSIRQIRCEFFPYEKK